MSLTTHHIIPHCTGFSNPRTCTCAELFQIWIHPRDFLCMFNSNGLSSPKWSLAWPTQRLKHSRVQVHRVTIFSIWLKMGACQAHASRTDALHTLCTGRLGRRLERSNLVVQVNSLCGPNSEWLKLCADLQHLSCSISPGFWPNIHAHDSTRRIHSLCRIQWDCCRTRRSHKSLTWCRSWHRTITTGQQANSGPGPLLPSMFWPYAIQWWRVRCCPTLCLRVVWVI